MLGSLLPPASTTKPRTTPPPAPLPAALLATKGAYAQGLVLFFTSVAFLFWFDR